MSSIADICNLALSHLGDEANIPGITPPHASAQARYCARFYPIARGALLELHPWTFATKRVAVSTVDNPVEGDWSYAYALPSTCIRPLSLLMPGQAEAFLSTETDAGSHPYLVEAAEDGTQILYTNVEGAYLRYIDLITDSTKYSPLFVSCLSRLLASYLAGPIIKGREGQREAQNQLKIFEVEYGKAAARNANVGKRNTYQTRRPDWIAGRGTPRLPDGRIVYE